jgi:hypothetical protein
MSKHYKITDINTGMETVVFNLAKYCRDNGLSYPHMIKMANPLLSYNGLKVEHTRPPVVITGEVIKTNVVKIGSGKRGRDYLIITPNNERIRTNDLKGYADKHCLSLQSLYKVANCKQSDHNGYIVKPVLKAA